MTISYIRQYWPSQKLTAVAQTQNIAANGSAVLNGTFANPLYPNQISFINNGFSRIVSITSTNNLSANTFLVRGTQNGVIIGEQITGPNNNTVYGTLSFDNVTSVSVNGASNGVSIGTGNIGYLPVIQLNNTSPNCFWQVGVILPTNPATGLSYATYAPLDPIINTGFTYDAMLANGNFANCGVMDASDSDQFSNFGLFGQYLLTRIFMSTNPTTDTAILSLIQQSG